MHKTIRVLLVRHAIAADLAQAGVQTDEERPLTARGRARMREAARGLRTLVPELDRIVSSPLLRATETAAILSRARTAWPAPEVSDLLSPGHAPAEVTAWLRRLPEGSRVCLVGHEPGISGLLAHLLGAPATDALAFRKGGAALVDVALDRGPTPAAAALAFFAPPRLLRRLG